MTTHMIVLVRHGESEEDVDPAIKSAVDDPARLTPRGVMQVQDTAARLSPDYRGFDEYLFVHSPSPRVVQTTDVFESCVTLDGATQRILEPTIRNLDWGNTHSGNVKEIEAERYRVGVLNFQFPDGDHTPTYVMKIGEACNGLLNLMTNGKRICLTFLTHGFALRVIVKHLLSMSEKDFRYLANPKNCFSLIIDVEVHDTHFVLSPRAPLPQVAFRID